MVLADTAAAKVKARRGTRSVGTVIRHSEHVRLEGFTFTATHLVVTARADTTTRIFLAPREQLPIQWRRRRPPA